MDKWSTVCKPNKDQTLITLISSLLASTRLQRHLYVKVKRTYLCIKQFKKRLIKYRTTIVFTTTKRLTSNDHMPLR